MSWPRPRSHALAAARFCEPVSRRRQGDSLGAPSVRWSSRCPDRHPILHHPHSRPAQSCARIVARSSKLRSFCRPARSCNASSARQSFVFRGWPSFSHKRLSPILRGERLPIDSGRRRLTMSARASMTAIEFRNSGRPPRPTARPITPPGIIGRNRLRNGLCRNDRGGPRATGRHAIQPCSGAWSLQVLCWRWAWS